MDSKPPIIPFGVVACTLPDTAFLEINCSGFERNFQYMYVFISISKNNFNLAPSFGVASETDLNAVENFFQTQILIKAINFPTIRNKSNEIKTYNNQVLTSMLLNNTADRTSSNWRVKRRSLDLNYLLISCNEYFFIQICIHSSCMIVFFN